jgi:hypothetical protein
MRNLGLPEDNSARGEKERFKAIFVPLCVTVRQSPSLPLPSKSLNHCVPKCFRCTEFLYKVCFLVWVTTMQGGRKMIRSISHLTEEILKP